MYMAHALAQKLSSKVTRHREAGTGVVLLRDAFSISACADAWLSCSMGEINTLDIDKQMQH